MYRYIVIFVICNLIYNGLDAQLSELNRIDIPGSFANSYDIAFDSLGMLWVGTDIGLLKYENHNRFINVLPDSIYPKTVFSLIADSNDRLWFINAKGTIFHYDGSQISKPVLHDIISYTFNDSNQELIIYSVNSIIRLNTQDLSQEIILQLNDNDIRMYTNRAYHYSDGVVYQVSKTDSFTINKTTKLDTSLLKYTTEQNLNIHPIVQAGKYIIFNKRKRFILFDKINKEYIQLKNCNSTFFTNNYIRSIQYKNDNDLIINTYNGSYYLFPKLDTFSHIEKTKNVSINNIAIKRKRLWISTGSIGVYAVPEQERNILTKNASGDIAIDKNKNIYIPNKNHIDIYKNNLLDTSLYISKNDIKNIYDFSDVLYISTIDKKFFELNIETLDINKSYLKGISLLESKNNLYSFGYSGFTDHGECNKAKKESRNKTPNGKTYKSVPYRSHYYAEKNNIVILSNEKRLDIFNEKTKTIEPIDEGKYIRSHFEDRNGNIWIGTEFGDGLYKLKNKKLEKYIDNNNYLKNISVRSIVESDTCLWIGTDKGIIKLNPNTGNSKLYNKAHGLINNNIFKLKYLNETLYALGSRGIFYFKTPFESIDENELKTTITSLAVNNIDTTLSKQIFLKNSEKNIKITFKSNDIFSFAKNKYYYRLIGSDSSWTSLPNEINFVKFQELDAGSYTFQVYSALENGDRKSSIDSIELNIAKALMDQLWIRTLFFLFSIAIIFIVFRIYFTKKNQYQKIENDLENEKMKSLLQQLNPHFIFNSLNSIQYFIFNDKKFDASKYLSNFSDLMRKNFEFSNKDYVTLAEEIEHIKNYLAMEKIRFENSVEIVIELDEKVNLQKEKIPPFIIQPYIENAFKHGLRIAKNGLLRITVQDEENYFTITISDNGVGIDATIEKKSNYNKNRYSSRRNISNRINLLNNTLRNKDFPIIIKTSKLNPDKSVNPGTKIYLKFPKQ